MDSKEKHYAWRKSTIYTVEFMGTDRGKPQRISFRPHEEDPYVIIGRHNQGRMGGKNGHYYTNSPAVYQEVVDQMNAIYPEAIKKVKWNLPARLTEGLAGTFYFDRNHLELSINYHAFSVQSYRDELLQALAERNVSPDFSIEIYSARDQERVLIEPLK